MPNLINELKGQMDKAIIEALEDNYGETAEAYALYDNKDYPFIKTGYPVRESFNRYVRKIKTRFTTYGGNTPIVEDKLLPKGSNKATFTEDSGGATVEVVDSTRIKTLEELLTECKVDLNIWKVDSYTCNKWEVNSNEQGITPLFQIKARLVRIVPLSVIPVIHPIVLPNAQKRVSGSSIKTNKTLVFGDAQIGFNRHRDGRWEAYHDRRAMHIILQILADNEFDNVVCLGDMIDATEASRYTQKPEFAGTLQPAINELGVYFERVRENTPTSRIVFMAGNHSIRLQNSMIDNLKYAYGLTAYKQDVPVMSLRNLLALDSMDIEFIEEYPKGTFWIGDNLKIIHGEFTSVAKELSISDIHTIKGHLHRIETQSRAIHGRDGIKQVSTHSIGCLCHIDGRVPGMTSRPNWQQGFAVVDHIGDNVAVNHIQIEDGICLYNGKKYIGYDNKPNGVY
jgi:hypothetical protein